MPLITAQQLQRYYTRFREIEVTFTREVVRVLHPQPQQIALRCLGDSYPCIIFSTSMAGARVIAALRADSLQKIRKANFVVSLRFAFLRPDRSEPLSFFVPGRIVGHGVYDRNSPDLYFITLEYSNKPPDDLIELLGQLLEADLNAERRQETRIDITPGTLGALGLESKEARILIGGKPRVCILRDLSFSGAKALLFAVAEDLLGREVVLQPAFRGRSAGLSLPGRILRYEEVAGREDIGAIGIRFDDLSIPIGYKMIINGFLRSHPRLAERLQS